MRKGRGETLSSLLLAPSGRPQFPSSRMSRGNKRDIDRARAQKRMEANGKGKSGDGLTPEQRRERDAKALAEKIAKKDGAAAAK
ncbi:hypothetical protein HXX76_004988 [Chlamydomonas incerta]|uniref:Small EDRK-rich factor-like N-terminal domain-containing protein n=1 Tax=Chlamydomonas incerta TaxID=51695 RepID=A0A835T8Z1_CHLIN|nr:hypothetical protein HXX76_004988 [Chlamydomonas incerta]|eukprot:KAG2439636.1 hypothetical protein HXX76_004988 [Chlamydomonas incerta]